MPAVVTWDLPIPHLHFNPVSVFQWDSTLPLCPVILGITQWENLESLVCEAMKSSLIWS